jgi:hypothetical protein
MMPMSHANPWTRVAAPPSEQAFERPLCDAQVVATDIDFTRAERELAHANDQLALARAYPGRDRKFPSAPPSAS